MSEFFVSAMNHVFEILKEVWSGVLVTLVTQGIIILWSKTAGFWVFRKLWMKSWARHRLNNAAGARDLWQLRELLFVIYYDLVDRNMVLLNDLRVSLWKAAMLLTKEMTFMTAQGSGDESERRGALLELVNTDPEKARSIINQIMITGTSSDAMKRFASELSRMLDSLPNESINEDNDGTN